MDAHGAGPSPTQATAATASGASGWSRYRVLKELGSGSFGVVYACKDLTAAVAHEAFDRRFANKTTTGEQHVAGDDGEEEARRLLPPLLVAVKAVPLMPLSEAETALAMNEAAILQCLDHPNVLRYIDCFVDEEQQLCTVTEFVDGGDLAEWIRKKRATWRRPLPSSNSNNADKQSGSIKKNNNNSSITNTTDNSDVANDEQPQKRGDRKGQQAVPSRLRKAVRVFNPMANDNDHDNDDANANINNGGAENNNNSSTNNNGNANTTDNANSNTTTNANNHQQQQNSNKRREEDWGAAYGEGGADAEFYETLNRTRRLATSTSVTSHGGFGTKGKLNRGGGTDGGGGSLFFGGGDDFWEEGGAGGGGGPAAFFGNNSYFSTFDGKYTRSVHGGGGANNSLLGTLDAASASQRRPQSADNADDLVGRIDQYWDAFIVLDVARQALEGLKYVHGQSILHRDVKPANIFITADMTVKIGDFGVSKMLSAAAASSFSPMASRLSAVADATGDPNNANAAPADAPLTTRTFIGTPHYICPELCLGEPYSFPADVWALGVVLYELFTLELPFDAANVLALMHVVSEGQYDAALLAERTLSETQRREVSESHGEAYLAQSEGLGPLVAAMVRSMLTVDYTARPTAWQLHAMFFGDGGEGDAGAEGGADVLSLSPSRPATAAAQQSPHQRLDENGQQRKPPPPPLLGPAGDGGNNDNANATISNSASEKAGDDDGQPLSSSAVSPLEDLRQQQQLLLSGGWATGSGARALRNSITRSRANNINTNANATNVVGGGEEDTVIVGGGDAEADAAADAAAKGAALPDPLSPILLQPLATTSATADPHPLHVQKDAAPNVGGRGLGQAPPHRGASPSPPPPPFAPSIAPAPRAASVSASVDTNTRVPFSAGAAVAVPTAGRTPQMERVGLNPSFDLIVEATGRATAAAAAVKTSAAKTANDSNVPSSKSGAADILSHNPNIAAALEQTLARIGGSVALCCDLSTAVEPSLRHSIEAEAALRRRAVSASQVGPSVTLSLRNSARTLRGGGAEAAAASMAPAPVPRSTIAVLNSYDSVTPSFGGVPPSPLATTDPLSGASAVAGDKKGSKKRRASITASSRDGDGDGAHGKEEAGEQQQRQKGKRAVKPLAAAALAVAEGVAEGEGEDVDNANANAIGDEAAAPVSTRSGKSRKPRRTRNEEGEEANSAKSPSSTKKRRRREGETLDQTATTEELVAGPTESAVAASSCVDDTAQLPSASSASVVSPSAVLAALRRHEKREREREAAGGVHAATADTPTGDVAAARKGKKDGIVSANGTPRHASKGRRGSHTAASQKADATQHSHHHHHHHGNHQQGHAAHPPPPPHFSPSELLTAEDEAAIAAAIEAAPMVRNAEAFSHLLLKDCGDRVISVGAAPPPRAVVPLFGGLAAEEEEDIVVVTSSAAAAAPLPPSPSVTPRRRRSSAVAFEDLPQGVGGGDRGTPEATAAAVGVGQVGASPPHVTASPSPPRPRGDGLADPAQQRHLTGVAMHASIGTARNTNTSYARSAASSRWGTALSGVGVGLATPRRSVASLQEELAIRMAAARTHQQQQQPQQSNGLAPSAQAGGHSSAAGIGSAPPLPSSAVAQHDDMASLLATVMGAHGTPPRPASTASAGRSPAHSLPSPSAHSASHAASPSSAIGRAGDLTNAPQSAGASALPSAGTSVAPTPMARPETEGGNPNKGAIVGETVAPSLPPSRCGGGASGGVVRVGGGFSGFVFNTADWLSNGRGDDAEGEEDEGERGEEDGKASRDAVSAISAAMDNTKAFGHNLQTQQPQSHRPYTSHAAADAVRRGGDGGYGGGGGGGGGGRKVAFSAIPFEGIATYHGAPTAANRDGSTGATPRPSTASEALGNTARGGHGIASNNSTAAVGTNAANSGTSVVGRPLLPPTSALHDSAERERRIQLLRATARRHFVRRQVMANAYGLAAQQLQSERLAAAAAAAGVGHLGRPPSPPAAYAASLLHRAPVAFARPPLVPTANGFFPSSSAAATAANPKGSAMLTGIASPLSATAGSAHALGGTRSGGVGGIGEGGGIEEALLEGTATFAASATGRKVLALKRAVAEEAQRRAEEAAAYEATYGTVSSDAAFFSSYKKAYASAALAGTLNATASPLAEAEDDGDADASEDEDEDAEESGGAAKEGAAPAARLTPSPPPPTETDRHHHHHHRQQHTAGAKKGGLSSSHLPSSNKKKKHSHSSAALREHIEATDRVLGEFRSYGRTFLASQMARGEVIPELEEAEETDEEDEGDEEGDGTVSSETSSSSDDDEEEEEEDAESTSSDDSSSSSSDSDEEEEEEDEESDEEDYEETSSSSSSSEEEDEDAGSDEDDGVLHFPIAITLLPPSTPPAASAKHTTVRFDGGEATSVGTIAGRACAMLNRSAAKASAKKKGTTKSGALSGVKQRRFVCQIPVSDGDDDDGDEDDEDEKHSNASGVSSSTGSDDGSGTDEEASSSKASTTELVTISLETLGLLGLSSPSQKPKAAPNKAPIIASREAWADVVDRHTNAIAAKAATAAAKGLARLEAEARKSLAAAQRAHRRRWAKRKAKADARALRKKDKKKGGCGGDTAAQQKQTKKKDSPPPLPPRVGERIRRRQQRRTDRLLRSHVRRLSRTSVLAVTVAVASFE